MSPEDYAAGQGTLSFAPGETEKTISLSVVDDAVREDADDSGFWESFLVSLAHEDGPIGESGCRTAGRWRSGSWTTTARRERDNGNGGGGQTPPTGVTLSVLPARVGEGDAATTVTVTAALIGGTRDTATTVSVTVGSGTASAGSDFAAVSGFDIAIAASARSATGTFSLAPVQDAVPWFDLRNRHG